MILQEYYKCSYNLSNYLKNRRCFIVLGNTWKSQSEKILVNDIFTSIKNLLPNFCPSTVTNFSSWKGSDFESWKKNMWGEGMFSYSYRIFYNWNGSENKFKIFSLTLLKNKII